MKSFNTQFTNTKDLTHYITSHNLHSQKNILVQIFTGIVDEKTLLGLSQHIKDLIPQANILGTTTAGEILAGEMYDKTILLSFTTFDASLVKSKLVTFDKDFEIDFLSTAPLQ